MDFFEHQDQARRRTVWLVTVYAIVVAAICALVYLLSVAFVGSTEDGTPDFTAPPAKTMFPSSFGMTFSVDPLVTVFFLA